MSQSPANTKPSLLQAHSSAIVVGLGDTGFSAVRYLRARGLQVSVVDTRAKPALASELALSYPEVVAHYGGFSDHLVGAGLIVLSPGVALAEPALRAARADGAQIVSDIELFLQENSQPVIAITGSNGKSTVTSLVGEMCACDGLSVLVAGNIGLPVLDALTDAHDYQVAVLELSSFQLEATSQVPAEASAILNISADHLDRYASMGDYVLAKARILRNAKRAVLPRHDEQLKQITHTSELLSFDLDEPTNDAEYGVKQKSSGRWLMRGEQSLMRLSEVPLVGLHNIKNVLSAFALVEFLQLPLDKVVGAVKDFQGLPHRMQTVALKDGVTFVNDSKATNIGATATALSSLEGEVIWIAGGQGKGADFSELNDALGGNIKMLLLFGEDAQQIEQALEGRLLIQRVNDMQQAVQLAFANAGAGSIVLLSPACASFDMFKGFEHRGDVFIDAVSALQERGAA